MKRFVQLHIPDSGCADGRPRDLYNLNSSYGGEDALKDCVSALQAAGLKVLCDAVLNHRCAHSQARRWLHQPWLAFKFSALRLSVKYDTRHLDHHSSRCFSF